MSYEAALIVMSESLGDDCSDAVISFAAMEFEDELCFECGDVKEACECGVTFVTKDD